MIRKILSNWVGHAGQWLLLVAVACCTLPAHAAKRALVVGIDEYRNVRTLVNAGNDARAIAEALAHVGYQVKLLDSHPARGELLDELRAFKNRIEGGDEVVFFFSGHGVQLGDTNYLLPSDVRNLSEGQVRDDAVSLSRILADLRSQRPAFTLAIVDACRDNPFRSTGRAIGGKGLTGVAGATGQMVIYAAGEGQQALDRLNDRDRSPNGVFTRVFKREMLRAGVPIHQVLRNVRDEVFALARGEGHEQVPAIYDQVIGNFYFVSGRAQEVADESLAGPMVRIEPGCFMMGSPTWESGREDDERQHWVCIERVYEIGRFEVTVGQFRRFADSAGYRTDAERDVGGRSGCFTLEKGGDKWDWRKGRSWRSPGFDQGEDHPVVCVSWNDAQKYLDWLNGQRLGGYRLATEAEWEYAARAGSSGSRPWGEDPDGACRYANVPDQTKSPFGGFLWSQRHDCADGYWYTAPVGRYKANRWGLQDMIGNVWEWTCSGYDPGYGDGELGCADRASLFVTRGGSWIGNPRFARSAIRFRYSPTSRLDVLGFRLARTLP